MSKNSLILLGLFFCRYARCFRTGHGMGCIFKKRIDPEKLFI